jgi:hypothetical protein
MKLLTEELKSKLPKLGETGEEPEALVKLFTPWANWTWFIFLFCFEGVVPQFYRLRIRSGKIFPAPCLH